jgi:pimeloyl-ACP methyl ester carboxylesterase
MPHLRTPDGRFQGLPGFPWAGRFVDDLPALQGLRMHRIDEGRRDAPVTWLCLHGNPAWSYLYRKMIPVFLAAGHRVVAPDMPGFGKSDKPRDEAVHTFSWHRAVLAEMVERLDLRNVNLVVQDWGGIIGLTLPLLEPGRYRGLLVMNTALATGEEPLPEGFLQWRAMCRARPDYSVARLLARGNPQLTEAERAAYDAPFPTTEHRAATRAFPEHVPAFPTSDGAAISRRAAGFWASEWAGRSMMAIGERDPVFTPEHMEVLRQRIRGCPPPIRVPQAGHFVQEHGEPIAIEALRALGETAAG